MGLDLVKKKIGQTPLEALEEFRLKKKINKEVPMTYAGRLDPMAEGLLIILSGEDCKNKDKYLSLDKEYEFQILFGVSTDTFDILGKILNTKGNPLQKEEFEKLIKKNLKNFKGKINQKYPLYSSKTVSGKPLFTYARENKEVEIPEKEINIYNLKYLKIKKISNKSLLKIIGNRINKVKGPARNAKHDFAGGDFRQKEILNLWQKFLKEKNDFYILDFKAKVSSGTYIRSLSYNLGASLDIPSLAFSIKRTKIGKYSI